MLGVQETSYATTAPSARDPDAVLEPTGGPRAGPGGVSGGGDRDDLARVLDRARDAREALSSGRLEVIRLLWALVPVIERVARQDPSAAAVLRETLTTIIVGLEMEGAVGGDKVDCALCPDAVVAAGSIVAKWRISLARAAPPLHRTSRILEAEEVEAVVVAVRLVAAQGDAACEQALLTALPDDVALWLFGESDIPHDQLVAALSASVQKLALLVIVDPTPWHRRALAWLAKRRPRLLR